jgi:carbon storage regulator
MLVLTRRVDESIVIGDDTRVKIVAIKGDYVRLGVDAPRSTPIHREEVYEAIQRENQAAAVDVSKDRMAAAAGLLAARAATGDESELPAE